MGARLMAMRILALIACLLVAGPAAAQAPRASHCIAVAEAPGVEYVQRASYAGGLEPFAVRLHYIDHAMFLLETAAGATAVTDYVGFIGATDFFPDVATMNRAHSSHWTASPDPRIPHLMRGWTGPGQAVETGDLYVRNVPTDIRGSVFMEGQGGSAIEDGNSIYVFEAAGLCIGHLGHLHHVPDDAQYAALGRMDVVMAPVDGGLTLPRAELIEVLATLKSQVVIPMHWFGRGNLERFLSDMSGEFEIERPGGPAIELSLRDLPDRPTIVVLEPEWLIEPARPDAADPPAE